jgi:hypothetical protein
VRPPLPYPPPPCAPAAAETPRLGSQRSPGSPPTLPAHCSLLSPLPLLPPPRIVPPLAPAQPLCPASPPAAATQEHHGLDITEHGESMLPSVEQGEPLHRARGPCSGSETAVDPPPLPPPAAAGGTTPGDEEKAAGAVVVAVALYQPPVEAVSNCNGEQEREPTTTVVPFA